MKKHTKEALRDLAWTVATCGVYFVVIFLRVLFTSKEGQELVEEKIDKQIKAKLIGEEERRGKHDKR